MSRAPARKGPAPRRAPMPPLRNASAGDVMRGASARARRYARQYAPKKTDPTSRENLADAAASLAGGVGTAMAGGLLADKFDPRWSNVVAAGVAGTTSLFVQKGGWRTFLQAMASASAGQAALAWMADDEPTPPPKEPAKVADKGKATAPTGKPLTPGDGNPAKRNAMPSSAMDRAFARSEARIAQVLADDGYDA